LCPGDNRHFLGHMGLGVGDLNCPPHFAVFVHSDFHSFHSSDLSAVLDRELQFQLHVHFGVICICIDVHMQDHNVERRANSLHMHATH
jgi:hypothetical protein